jgi:hypothetical protein
VFERARIVKNLTKKDVYERKTNISKPGSARKDKAKTRRGYSGVIQVQLNKPPLIKGKSGDNGVCWKKGRAKDMGKPGRHRAPTADP